MSDFKLGTICELKETFRNMALPQIGHIQVINYSGDAIDEIFLQSQTGTIRRFPYNSFIVYYEVAGQFDLVPITGLKDNNGVIQVPVEHGPTQRALRPYGKI